MATELEFDNFINSLTPQSSYLDVGFNTSMTKTIYLEEGQSTVDTGSLLEGLDFDKLIGSGVTSDFRGRIKIDFNKGQIIINDGSLDRVLIGDLETES